MFLLSATRDYNIILCTLPNGKKTQAKKEWGKDWGKYLFLYFKIWRDLWGQNIDLKKGSFHVLDSLNSRKPQPWHMDSKCGVLF